jgi:ferredoxin--NADP+ reductase
VLDTPYTICSSSKGDTGYKNTLSICIKGYDKKNNFINDKKPGDEIQITGPTGTDCVIPKDLKANVLMIGTGLGIPHFRSFLHKWFDGTDGKYEGQAMLLCGTSFYKELDQL